MVQDERPAPFEAAPSTPSAITDAARALQGLTDLSDRRMAVNLALLQAALEPDPDHPALTDGAALAHAKARLGLDEAQADGSGGTLEGAGGGEGQDRAPDPDADG